MCGRFTQTRPAQEVADYFGLPAAPAIEPRYNIAPTQAVFAVRAGASGPEPALLRWGLVPSWAADLKVGVRMLNARAETVAEKPAYRAAFQRRRCLVPADGFYEWRAAGKKKQPIHFRLLDGRLFAIAALWERWKGPAGDVVESFAVLTTSANAVVAPVHDRMPVLLGPAQFAAWLAAGSAPEALQAMLAPWPAEEMVGVPVSDRVNNARNEGPECLVAA